MEFTLMSFHCKYKSTTKLIYYIEPENIFHQISLNIQHIKKLG